MLEFFQYFSRRFQYMLHLENFLCPFANITIHEIQGGKKEVEVIIGEMKEAADGLMGEEADKGEIGLEVIGEVDIGVDRVQDGGVDGVQAGEVDGEKGKETGLFSIFIIIDFQYM